MSFAAIQARLMLLIAMQFDVELQTQLLMQHKLYLTNKSSELLNLKVENEPGSKADKILQTRIHHLSEIEKFLDSRLQRLQNQAKALSAERESITQIINQNIQRSFKNAYG